jgi:DNA ligase-1
MQTTYPILYAKSSTGAVLIWWMETNEQGNAYRTFSGQKNGQIVESSYTFPKPKNEGKANGTTEETQTELEILAKYKKKRKEKYKDNIKDVDIKEFISPMLAKKYNDYKDSIDFYDGTWGMSPKLNGARCIATKDGLFTRTGEEYLSIPHIHEDLKPFFELYPNAILDGELYNYELRQQLNELMKLVRKTVKITVEELLESAEKVQYHVYDGYIPDDKDLGESVSYDERHDWIHTELDKTSFYYRPVPCTTITDEEQLMKYFNDLLEEGQEGVMLRKTTAGYENKRSKLY